MPRRGRATVGGISRSIQRQTQRLLQTGRRFERFDQIRQRHFWSTALFVPDTNGFISGAQQLFVTPAGQNGQGFPSGVTLSERETNWKSSNRVPDNQNFECTELGVTVGVLPSDVDATSTANVVSGFTANSFLQSTVLNITYLTNSVPLGMASDFAQAAGPTGGSFQPGAAINVAATYTQNAATGPSGTAARILTNGFAAPALRRRFKIPILLQHGETFSFELQLPRSVYTNASIYARMDFFATESFAEKS